MLYGDRWADADGAENALGEFNPNLSYVSNNFDKRTFIFVRWI
jgi:hypothetical protein